MSAGTDSTAEGSAISLPKGGGAVSGLGEKFSPDLFTGTGNFAVPIAVPAAGGGAAAAVAGVQHRGRERAVRAGLAAEPARGVPQDLRGIPRYIDAAGPGTDGLRADVFVLSGAEDLVPVPRQLSGAGAVPAADRGAVRPDRARPRCRRELLGGRGKDGLLTRYGTPRPDGADAAWRDPAVVADPGDPGRVFGWRVTATQDALGNLIGYTYLPDQGREPGTSGRR